MHASELWEGKGLGPTLARIALSPFSLLYGLGWEAYLACYRLGFKRASHPHAPIICVGNLVSGGSGKTPVTLQLALLLREMGYPVVVSSSGYGSPRAEAASIAPDGSLDPRDWGDEAAMFRLAIPDLPLIVGRRRVLAAELCHKSFSDSILLMDDGFQHLPLKKDLSILLDPDRPANRMCLPAGPYREPRWNRRRADLVLPGEFKVAESVKLVDPKGLETKIPPIASLLCALGQPQRVAAALESLGVRIESRHFLPDHDPLTGGTLIESLSRNLPTVVTMKDWVKLRGRADLGDREFLILRHGAQIEPAAKFREWLQTKLDAIQKANNSQ